MNGAQAMVRTLVDSGVDVCFTNPGTSEMHFVAALDTVPEMRAVLGLFEGVVTGAADGYARMAGRPAGTLLHLGPGLGNGLANLHNARRARTPMVNIVGDHATYHERYDAPLQSDIDTVARNVSPWIRRTTATADLGRDTAEAVAAAMAPPGQIATLILPADVSWSEGGTPCPPIAPAARTSVADAVVEDVAKALVSGEPVVLLLGGSAMRSGPIGAAARIAGVAGAKVLAETFPPRHERGAGIPNVDRLAYLAEFAASQLAGAKHLVLVDAREPVSFFAYPGKDSYLVPDGCAVHVLAGDADDAEDALLRLADRLGAGPVPGAGASRPELPSGPLSAEMVAAAIGALLPEGAIVSDEAQTSGLWIPGMTAGAPPHDWLTNPGGSIGQGLPVAVGAAVACPDRKVLALQADGSGMYTLQSLWTMAREDLDVITVVFTNRSYAILNLELARTGAGDAGPKAKDMLDLTRPDLDFVKLAEGMGVEAVSCDTGESFADALRSALAAKGPRLIDAVIPSGF
jgi:acetolactate synthase-1/2/3 large subunit